MWAFLAEKINKNYNLFVSPLQVETRYRCVMKRRKKTIDNNMTSGKIYIEPEFEEEIDEIIAKDDSLLPECLYTPGSKMEKCGSEAVKTISRPPTYYVTHQEKTAQPSTSHSSRSRTPQSSTSKTTPIDPEPPATLLYSELDVSTDSEILTGSEETAPKKRVRKSVQEVFSEKFLAEKKSKNARIFKRKGN